MIAQVHLDYQYGILVSVTFELELQQYDIFSVR